MWLQILNKLLDLRLVQYALLLISIILITFTFYLSVKVKTIELISEKRKNAVTELEFNLTNQNAKIVDYNDKLKVQETNLKVAQTQAAKIALESNKTLQGILEYEFSSDCDSGVKEALNFVRNKK